MSQLIPTAVRVIDRAPQHSARDKITALVRLSDGSIEKVLVDPSEIDAFISSVGAQAIVALVPAQASMGNRPSRETGQMSTSGPPDQTSPGAGTAPIPLPQTTPIP